MLLRLSSLVIAAVLVCAHAAASDLQLRYDKPAAVWTEALPMGNGRVGAMLFGGVADERLQINEATLWGGSPQPYAKAESYEQLQQVRTLIFQGKIDAAEKLSTALMGEPPLLMPYQPFCDLRLHFPGPEDASDYARDLNLEEAIAAVHYRLGTVGFRREAFVSYPDQILVVRISSDVQGQVNFSVVLDSPQPEVVTQARTEAALQLTGQIQARTNPKASWVGSWDRPGMTYAAVLKVLPEGGTVRTVDNHLEVSGANAVTLLFSNATSFRNYRDIGGNALALAERRLEAASRHPYEQLRRRHVEDFRGLFSRVRLNLGESHSTLSTDRRLASFASSDDPQFLALYFAYGRYLLISSSRPGGQPANLQGIWNQELIPPWGSKWTTNINLQMNYWQADAADLWETEEPLWDLVEDLRSSGNDTARKIYHAKGWVLHHNTDIWRATAPVDGPWGLWPMGEVWLANQMWDHFEFTQDTAFLRRRAYPAMREAAQFLLSTLVEAPAGTPFAGRWVTNPSTSPENEYLIGATHAHLTYAATMDVELIRELIDNCRHATELLKIDGQLRAKLDQVEAKLPPLQIGARGQLQEWIEDYGEVEPSHRHVSHLYALYPGHDISVRTTPALAAAAAQTLELRGDGGTGWSRVWRVALWARLQKPERAYENLKLLITGSTLPNLFDLCPPFQIDGNLGAPAAMIEMLVQSTPADITLLPALPREWPEGSLLGVRVRGGAVLDVTWSGGSLADVALRAEQATSYTVHYGDRSTQVHLRPGETVRLNQLLMPGRS